MKKKVFLLIIFIFPNVLLSLDYEQDLATKLLYTKNEKELVLKSILFFPIFPWFQYSFDKRPATYQYNNFYKFNTSIDYFLIKGASSYSGYEVSGSIFKNYLGIDVSYNTTSDRIKKDNDFLDLNLVFRLRPRLHLEPRMSIGMIHVSTNNNSAYGFSFSFFNYKIMYNRRFHVYLENYISRLKSKIYVRGIVGLEYYIHPTISFKAVADIRHVFGELIHQYKFGISANI